MHDNHDEIIDSIIALEGHRYHSISRGSTTETKPSYFKHLKTMYSRNWEGLYNPNNVFIPFILVSVESVLRQMVECTGEPTASNLLERLLGKNSPITDVFDELEYIAWKKIPESDKVVYAGSVKEESKIELLKDILIENGIVNGEDELLIRQNNKSAYKQRLYSVLLLIQQKYYKRGERGNSFRNSVMHANLMLIMIRDNVFGELLEDYNKLLKASWLDPVIKSV